MTNSKERKILEFVKNEEGISVNIEDKTEIVDVLIGIGLTLDMIIKNQGVDKKQVLQDINKILKTIEKENNKKEGEKENGSK